MYLNDLEETVVLIAAVFIIIAFIVKTYKDIKETIAEEKQKLYESRFKETTSKDYHDCFFDAIWTYKANK